MRQRWWLIYPALLAPRKAAEIAQQGGVSVTTVRRVISPYTRLGSAALETPGTGGRRHEYLTLAQERAFLPPFVARAPKGEIATAEQIQPACEAHVNHAVHISSLYRLWDRQGWRKLVARPRQPKATAPEQTAFTKTSSTLYRQQLPREIPLMSDRGCRWRKRKVAWVASVCPDGLGLRREFARKLPINSSVNTPMRMLLGRHKRAK